jgi:hypothetical protein
VVAIPPNRPPTETCWRLRAKKDGFCQKAGAFALKTVAKPGEKLNSRPHFSSTK